MKTRKLYRLLLLNILLGTSLSLMATVYTLDAFQDTVFIGAGELQGQTLTVKYDPSSISECSIMTQEGYLWVTQNKSNRITEAANNASINHQEMVYNVSWPELVSVSAVYAGQTQQERDTWRYLKLGLDSREENFLFTDTSEIWFKIFNSKEELIDKKVYLKVTMHSSYDSLNEQEHRLHIIFNKEKEKLILQAVHLLIILNHDKKLVRGFQVDGIPDKLL